MNNEQRTFIEFRRSLKTRVGIEIRVCPKCHKTVGETEVEYNDLEAWAFKDNIAVVVDGHGCCY
jgi:hypothetical protein